MFCLQGLFTSISIFVPIMMMPQMLVEQFKWTTVEVGFIFTVPYQVSVVLNPIIGWYAENYGNRMTLMIMGSIMVWASHISLFIMLRNDDESWERSYASAFVPQVMLGFGYSTYAVIYWGSIPYLVKGKVTGTAFGVAHTFKNMALVVAAPLVGQMIDKTTESSGYN